MSRAVTAGWVGWVGIRSDASCISQCSLHCEVLLAQCGVGQAGAWVFAGCLDLPPHTYTWLAVEDRQLPSVAAAVLPTC